MKTLRISPGFLAGIAFTFYPSAMPAEPARALRFQANSPAQARAWQATARAELFALMMGGQEPARCPLNPQVLRRLDGPGGYVLEELTLQTLPDRRAHVWLGRPAQPKGRVVL